MRLSIDAYRRQFSPMPSRATVKQWAKNSDTLKLHQPGGRGCTIYVEEVGGEQSVSLEDQMLEAMRAARKEAS